MSDAGKNPSSPWQYSVISWSTVILYSHTHATLCSLERKNTNGGKITQDETFSWTLAFFSPLIKQWSIYHHQSLLYREGTVHSLRACYFHEPFNVASKGIYIIYHSEASQKNPYTHSVPVYCLFFSQALTLKHFFFPEVFSKTFLSRDLVTWISSWGNHINSPRTHTHSASLWAFFFYFALQSVSAPDYLRSPFVFPSQ